MFDSGPIIHPIEDLEARTIVKGNQKVHQVLVQWDQHPIFEATWEDMDDLRQKFPNYNLEDKVVFNGDGIVMKPDNGKVLEDHELSANQKNGPQNIHDNEVDSNSEAMIGPCRGMRTRIPHSMWGDYVKG
jgi:hypothetical protein